MRTRIASAMTSLRACDVRPARTNTPALPFTGQPLRSSPVVPCSGSALADESCRMPGSRAAARPLMRLSSAQGRGLYDFDRCLTAPRHRATAQFRTRWTRSTLAARHGQAPLRADGVPRLCPALAWIQRACAQVKAHNVCNVKACPPFGAELLLTLFVRIREPGAEMVFAVVTVALCLNFDSARLSLETLIQRTSAHRRRACQRPVAWRSPARRCCSTCTGAQATFEGRHVDRAAPVADVLTCSCLLSLHMLRFAEHAPHPDSQVHRPRQTFIGKSLQPLLSRIGHACWTG